MAKKYVITPGMRFGRFTVLSEDNPRIDTDGYPSRRMIKVQCDCGTERIVYLHKLRSGHTQSCGCYQRQRAVEGNVTHGHAPYKYSRQTSTYHIWSNMLARCSNPRVPHYRYYGGRGISVCARWATFENFLADMGERPPGLSLDRLNNDGNYEPGNCAWRTATEQVRNRRPRNSVVPRHQSCS